MDVEIKVPSAKNLQLYKHISLKDRVGQEIALRASPTTRNFASFLSSQLIRLLLFKILFKHKAIYMSQECNSMLPWCDLHSWLGI